MGRKAKYSYPESDKEIILEEINGMGSSGVHKKDVYTIERNVTAERKNL